ncbi:Uncharacterized protein HZ326_29390 [Fusarium oxysporum f. sp. albedinis]|nr:Uncharacterized protein HZ326_29390 [Fusarium oxysporum f. sp. albedinis]
MVAIIAGSSISRCLHAFGWNCISKQQASWRCRADPDDATDATCLADARLADVGSSLLAKRRLHHTVGKTQLGKCKMRRKARYLASRMTISSPAGSFRRA